MKAMGMLAGVLFTSSLAAAEAPAANFATTSTAELSPAALPEMDDTPQTLLGPDGFLRHSGWFVAPSFGMTSIDGHVGYLTGLRGAWVTNRTFGIGLAGSAMGWDAYHSDSPGSGPERRIQGGYGGLLFQYNLAPDRLVHGFVDTTIGGGAACYQVHDASQWDSCRSMEAFFVFEPSANVEVNVTKFMRLAVGGGYRLALADTMNKGLASSDLSGLVARANVEFGQF
jgi:hypothetical protein